jgi:hypothetical protein
MEMVDSGPLRTSQISEIPEDKGSEQFPPYIKAMKKLESMSYAIQQQTKTNSKLADNLGMLVEKFARMEERMNAVQAENSNLLEILDDMQEKIKALQNKPTINIFAPRTTAYASVVNSGLPPRPAANNATTSGNNRKIQLLPHIPHMAHRLNVLDVNSSATQNIPGISTTSYSSEDKPSSPSSMLNSGRSRPPIHSLPQHSFSENISFPTAPNVSIPRHSSSSHQPNTIPKPNQKAFTQSFIISLNCAKNIQTTSYIL